MQNIPRMRSINELAEETGLSYRFLRDLIRDGKIQYVKTGRKFLINVESLTAYLNGEGGTE